MSITMEPTVEVRQEEEPTMPKRPRGFPEHFPFEIKEQLWTHGFGAERFFSGFKVDGTQFELKPCETSTKRSKFDRFDYREKEGEIWGEFRIIKIRKSSSPDT